MITFNPGPSQLSPLIRDAIQRIAMSDFLSLSHRSPEFTEFFHDLLIRFKTVFRILESYFLFFVLSAIAAMSILIGNLVEDQCTHFVHGAFSKRFAQTGEAMGRKVQAIITDPEVPVNWRDHQPQKGTEMIAVTHNETSTGLMWPLHEISELNQAFPNALLAVDVTSSFGAIPFHIPDADAWFGSVQKVLGLPAGLGFMVLSPRAMEKARSKKDMKVSGWMNLKILEEKYRKAQTFETPNALHLKLLDEQLVNWDLDDSFRLTMRKSKQMVSALTQAPMNWNPFIVEPHWRSLTVGCFNVDRPQYWHETARKHGFILGKGYGAWKNQCIRIANFPALTADHFQMLFYSLRKAG